MIFEILAFCSLITGAPYYDCSEQWVVMIASPEVIHLVCRAETYACAIAAFNVIFLPPDQRNYLDPCNRTALEHELLHLKNPLFHRGKANPIHQYDLCRNVWNWR